jgi:hypothetical protein
LILLAGPLASVAQGPNSQPAVNSGSNGAVPAVPESATNAPAESSTGPLRVVCKGNELTISANNSTLASILAEVNKCIGAKIDIPNDAAESRFFDTIGPGPVREVLASLLSASSFDYIIGISGSDPEKVETVVLIARGTGLSEGQSAETAGDSSLMRGNRVFQQMRQHFNTKGIPGVDDTAGPAADPNAGTNDDTPAAPPENPAASANQAVATDQTPAPAPDEASPAPTLHPAPAAPNAAPAPAQSTTTDNQITNMQQLFEQRRQMIANQNSPPK